MRKTKIIVTLGPSVESENIMAKLIESGADVARLNIAHGTVSYHQALAKRFRKVSKELGKNTAIMLDIKGPELRVKRAKIRFLKAGDKIKISDKGDLELNHNIYEFLNPDTRVLIHDGDLELKMLENGFAEVLRGGPVREHMGVNVPGVNFPLQYIQERDVEFMKAISDVDFIAASFVRTPRDVITLREKMNELSLEADIIAKIESQVGVDNIDDILEVSDGIMVARGDLGTEIPLENLPGVQKHLLRKTRFHGKPSIIATQILESMIHSPHPTRAEVSDIANAILDGGDALMLSGETAIGKYPVDAVRILARVAERADEILATRRREIELKGTISESVSNSAVLLAREIKANAILVLTKTGKTARLVSRHRVPMPIIAASPNPRILRKLSLYWGVSAFEIGTINNTDRAVYEAMKVAENSGIVKKGDVLVITGGEPSGVEGTTNFVWAQILGDIVARGTGFGDKIVQGEICRYPERCDVVVVERCVRDECPTTKALVIESKIYDPQTLREYVNRGSVILAGTGKIAEAKGMVIVDPFRGVIYK